MHHQYSSRVSPFQAKTGMPFGTLGRAAGLRTADDHRRRGLILGREDVARGPAHLGTELGQSLDQHRSLHRHVEAAGDPRASQRLLFAILLAQGHQPGHLLFSQNDLFAPGFGQLQVGDLVLEAGLGFDVDGHDGPPVSEREASEARGRASVSVATQ